LISYLGASDLVCAVEETEADPGNRPYALAHPEYAILPKVGPGHGGEPELIGAQNPDIVIKGDIDAANLDNLQTQLGVPVIGIVAPNIDTTENIQQFYDALNLVGNILHKEDRATEIINYLDGLLADLESRTSNIPDSERPTVYIAGLSSRGTHGIISTTSHYSPFVLTNSKNVVTLDMTSGTTGTVNIDLEIIPNLNPDVIFVDYAGLSLCQADVANHIDVFENMNAIKNNRVYGVMPSGSYGSQPDVLLTDVYYVGSVLYPEQFANIDPVEKANEIYTFLFGMPLYEDVAEIIGSFGPVDLQP
jgi:iron complex transport system substrate-binding protein